MRFVPLPGVSAQPEVIAEPWVVLEVTIKAVPDFPPPYRFVVCHDRKNFCGRVSSPIIEHDLENRRVRTRSGRIYLLSGPPAVDVDAWNVWLSIARSLPANDVSGDFWSGYCAGSAQLVDTCVNALEAAIKADTASRSVSSPTAAKS